MDTPRLQRNCWPVLKASACIALPSIQAAAQEITWSIPGDGGTPRDSNRIERVGRREFRVRASFEEGGQTVLRHAVSRVDLVCRNSGSRSADVTLHLDLSEDGKRTDYDNKPEAGMKLRDFIFIQPPGRDWMQVDGATERWVATVNFKAQPGETKIGLSPWYTYANYAMKRYGTRVWGWEMPWWNHSVAEVRASGAAFAKAFLTTIEEIHANASPISAGVSPSPLRGERGAVGRRPQM